MSSRRILITSGGTREPIDAVRSITNQSTGATGAALADACTEAGHEVLYLHSLTAKRPTLPCERSEFDTFDEFALRLRTAIQWWSPDTVLHAAAVSDFKVMNAGGDKIEGDAAHALQLRPNPKLIDEIRGISALGSKLTLIGFKLVSGLTPEAAHFAARKTLERSGADAIVLNDKSGFGWGEDHAFEWVTPKHVTRLPDRAELASQVVRFLEGAPDDSRA